LDQTGFCTVGDGGVRVAFEVNSRSTANLYGKILRLNVTMPENKHWDAAGTTYVQTEIVAKGLRHPWRFAFDGTVLFIGDVGSSFMEEIDAADLSDALLPLDFGWPDKEGEFCVSTSISPFLFPFLSHTHCHSDDSINPIHNYLTWVDSASIILGYPYRGANPAMAGMMISTDYTGRFIGNRWSAQKNRYETFDLKVVPELNLPNNPSGNYIVYSFGTDRRGDIYVLLGGEFETVVTSPYADGAIFRVRAGLFPPHL
jgi:hypothetical protein